MLPVSVYREIMKSLSDSNNRGYMSLKLAVAEIARRIDIALPDLKEPVKMIIAGGVAVNFYCGSRATTDVDASFSRRIALPEDLVVPYETPDGKLLTVHLDTNYNTTFAVMHEDYEQDAIAIELRDFVGKNIKLYLLSPVDLAVSKIARFEGPDRGDIAALAQADLIGPKDVAERAEDALSYYVGSLDRVRGNLREALRIIEETRRERRT
jgi:hypothetical protein